jgi:hypothetical protein
MPLKAFYCTYDVYSQIDLGRNQNPRKVLKCSQLLPFRLILAKFKFACYYWHTSLVKAMLFLRPNACRRILTSKNFVSRLHASALLRSSTALQPFKLADIGEGITECEVISWYVLHLIHVFALLCLSTRTRFA